MSAINNISFQLYIIHMNKNDLPPFVDLHNHSTASDGSDTPSELVEKASRAGLVAIALTDHDTVSGLKEAEEAAADYKIEFIRGCEISTSTEEGSVHMLGLWVPKNCPTLEAFLDHMLAKRRDRNAQMVKLMRNAGLDITMEEIEARAEHTPGRPHMAQLLVEKGYVQTIEEAFDKWLDYNGKAYVPKVAPRPEQAARILADQGASPIMAHPLLRERPAGWLENLIKDLKNSGLFGLEVWHSAQTEEQSKLLQALADKYDLGASGGSDYHGTKKKHINLGTGRGDLKIGLNVLLTLKNRRREMGLPC